MPREPGANFLEGVENDMLKNLVVPSSNCDGSEVVLFPDETSHNLRFISGRFSLSNSRCRGKVGVDTASGTARSTTAVRNKIDCFS